MWRLLRRLCGLRLDLAIAVAIAIVGMIVGAVYVDRVGQADYYQAEFAPAVMQTCGHGFTDYRGDPALRSFLSDRDGTYECPARFDETLRAPPTAFAISERYLFAAASLLWWISGISWASLLPLFALMYGVTFAGLYGVVRLVARRSIATVGALVLLFSPLYLGMLPSLRDFAKAPFIVVGLFLVGLLLTRRFSTRGFAGTGAALGLTMGLGYGFRVDVLVIVPLFLLALAFFTPGAPRGDWRGRLAALSAFAVTFAIGVAPIYVQMPSGGGNTTFVTIHGLMDPFDEALGVEQDLYSPGYLYNDGYTTSVIGAFAYRVERYRQPVHLGTAQMERFSRALYLRHAKTFPADIYIRSRAAFDRVFELGALSTTRAPAVPAEVDSTGMFAFARNVLGDGLRHLGGPLLLPFFAFVVLAGSRPRIALFVVLALVYVSFVSTLQYAPRHVFYLEFVWWLSAAFLLDRAIRFAPSFLGAVRATREGALDDAAAFWGAAIRVAVAALPVFLVLVGLVALLGPLRDYQDSRVETLLERYERAPRLDVSIRATLAGEGRTLLRVGDDDDVWRGPPDGVESALLVARFEPALCPYPVSAVARYESADPYNDWSQRLDLPMSPDLSRRVDVYFLAFRHADGAFAGFELPTEQRRCLTDVSAVETRNLPLLLYTTLLDDWRDVTRHETLTSEPRRRVFAQVDR
jgi:hypothetical protein